MAEKTATAAPKKKLVKLTFAEDFVLSGISATVSKTIAAPIERIKMVKQAEDHMVKKGTLEKPFSGIMDCARWIQNNEGFFAFWRSNFTNCLRYFPTQALNFSFKGQIKSIQSLKPDKKDSYLVSTTKNIISGGLAGGLGLFFVYSLDFARTKLANDLKSTKSGASGREYSGLIDVYKKVLKSDGIRGLYAGFNISFVGIFIYRVLYFGLYDSIMPLLPKDVPFAVRFGVGYVVTVAAGIASYPIDTIRRRMMMTSGDKGTLAYSGSIDCARYIWKNEGFKSYFKGAGANILRGIAGAGVISGFDSVTEVYCQYAYGPDCTLRK